VEALTVGLGGKMLFSRIDSDRLLHSIFAPMCSGEHEKQFDVISALAGDTPMDQARWTLE
jgi:hypothetical protein